MSNIQKTLKPLLLCIATLFCVTLASQEQKRVAIAAPIGRTTNVSDMEKNMVRSRLTAVIVNSSRYDAIDRINTDGILSEHSYQRNGLVDPEKIKTLGQQLRADLVCITYITKEQGYYHIEASVIDVDTAKIFNAADHVTQAGTPTALHAELEVWAYKLLKLDALTEAATAELAVKNAAAEKAKLEREAKDREAREAEEKRLAQIERDKQIAAERERASRETKVRNPQFREGGANDIVRDHVPVSGKVVVYIYGHNYGWVMGRIRINNNHIVDLDSSEYARFELFEGEYNITAGTKGELRPISIDIDAKNGEIYYILVDDGNSQYGSVPKPALEPASTGRQQVSKRKLKAKFYMK